MIRGQGLQRERKRLGTTGGGGRSKTDAQPLNFRLSWRTWPKPTFILVILVLLGWQISSHPRGKWWKQSPSLGNLIIHNSPGCAHPTTPARRHALGHIPGDGHGWVGPRAKEGRAVGAGGLLGQQLTAWGLMWGPGPQQVGNPVWLTGSGRAVNALRPLVLFPLYLLEILKWFCCSSWNFSLFSSPNEYIIGQQVVPPHLTWGQWLRLAPIGSFPFLVLGASREVQGRQSFGPGTARPHHQPEAESPSKAECEG